MYEDELNLAKDMQPEFQEPSSPTIYEEEGAEKENGAELATSTSKEEEQPAIEIEEQPENILEHETESKEAEAEEQIWENSDLEERWPNNQEEKEKEPKEEKEFEEEKEVECSNEVESMEQEKHAEKEEWLPSSPSPLPPPPLPSSPSPLPLSFFNFNNSHKCFDVVEFQNYKDLAELDYIEHIDFVFQEESKFNNKAKLRIAIGMGIMRIVLHLNKRIILILLLPLALHITFHIFSTLEIQTYVKTCLPPTLIFDPG